MSPLCSRNARCQKDAREQADRSSCSQSPHDKRGGMTPVLIPCSRNAHDQNVLVRRPQWDQHGCHSRGGKTSELGRSIRGKRMVSGTITHQNSLPSIQTMVPDTVLFREGEEGGTHRLHAQVADDSQRDAQTSDSLAQGRGISCLTLKTVADTVLFL